MKLLLATDGSAHSQAAIDLLNHVPFPDGSKIILATVLELPVPYFGVSGQFGAGQELIVPIRARAEETLKRQAESLRQIGWNVELLIRQGNAAEEILNIAAEQETDLIVVGSYGHGAVRSFLLGSVSQKVVKYASCSVLVVRESTRSKGESGSDTSTWEKMEILMAFDDSAVSYEAANILQSMPLAKDAEITILTIMPIITSYGMDIIERTSDFWQEDRKKAVTALQRVADELQKVHPHISAHLVESVDTSQEILERAKSLHSDLIIIGNKGKNAMDRFLLGSVTNRVIQHAPCSVWVVRKRVDPSD